MSMEDMPVIILLVFVSAISLILVGTLWGGFLTSLSSIPGGTSGNITAATNNISTALLLFDGIFLFYLIGLGMMTVVLAYYINTHPIFFIFSVLSLIISVITAALITNVFVEFGSNSVLSTAALSYPLTMTAMQNLPIFIGILGVLTMLALYRRKEG